MKVVYDPTRLLPTATASSSNGVNTPDRAIDGDTNTYWESNSESFPQITIDLTKILRVYQIDIVFDSTNRPTQFQIQSSDNVNEAEYGTMSGAFDLIRIVNFPVSGSNSYIITGSNNKTKDLRYLRIQMTQPTPGQMRIKEITVWASTTTASTTSRVKIGATYFTVEGHDILEIHLHEGPVSDKIGEMNFRLNNKNEKYLESQFPLGSRVLYWIDGTQKLFGQLSLFTPHYDTSGHIIDAQAKDFGDILLNQSVRNAWAGLTPSDSTAKNDILTQGPNSILGQVLSSSGGRYFPGTPTGYPNITSTLAGPNAIPYFKSQNKDAWSLLKDLQQQALDGAWGVQDPTFSLGINAPTQQSIPNAISNGAWVAYATDVQFPVSINPLQLDISNAIQGGVIVHSLTNAFIQTAGQADSGLKTPYNGSIANEPLLHYAEALQPVLFKISQLAASASLQTNISISLTNITTAGTGNPAIPQDVVDLIIESVAPWGVTRRLHIVGLPTGGGDIGGAWCQTSTIPADTAIDKYVDGTALTQSSIDLKGKYLAKYADGTNDIVTVIRLRALPFVFEPGTGAQCVNDSTKEETIKVTCTQIKVNFDATVKSPPQPYDFYVTTTTSSGQLVPDLLWFSRPRPGIDTSRNLDDSNTIRFYTDFPRSDNNNLILFDKMNDSYPQKDEYMATGTQTNPFQDKTTINARDPTYLAGTPPYHGSSEPQVLIGSPTLMSTIGRRRGGQDLSAHNISEVARAAIEQFNVSVNNVTRVTIKTRGNANFAPGQVVYLDSSFVSPTGFWYIISCVHDWTINGYETELTCSTDKLRFSTELVRLQGQIFKASLFGSNVSLKQNTSQITFVKIGADLNNLEGLTGSPEQTPLTNPQPSLRFPFNLVPEFSNIKHVSIQFSRALAPLVSGKYLAGSSQPGTAWDTANKLDYASVRLPDAFQNVNDGSSFAQRYAWGTTSANRIRVDFSCYIDQAAVDGQKLVCTVYTDTSKAGAGPIPASANWGVFVGPGLYALGGLILGAVGFKSAALERPESTGVSILIPFSALSTTSAANNSVNSSVEFELNQPIAPNTAFWVAFSTQSSGGTNVRMLCSNQGNPNQPCATKTPDGPWVSSGAPGGPTNGQLVSQIFPQNALSFTGAASYGSGSGLQAWDSLGFGQNYQAISPTGQDQTNSFIDFDTSWIARKSSISRVDNWIICSAGGNVSRLDYSMIVTYERF